MTGCILSWEEEIVARKRSPLVESVNKHLKLRLELY